MISKKAAIECRTDVGTTLLMAAAHEGTLNSVQQLIDAKSDVNALSVHKESALYAALWRKTENIPIIKCLLENNAKFVYLEKGHLSKYFGITLYNNHIETFKLFLEYSLTKIAELYKKNADEINITEFMFVVFRTILESGKENFLNMLLSEIEYKEFFEKNVQNIFEYFLITGSGGGIKILLDRKFPVNQSSKSELSFSRGSYRV